VGTTVYYGAMTAEASPARSFDDRLPPDVGAGGLSRFASYQQYPAFTWRWFLHRAVVFWPLAAAYGVFLGMWHASSMTTWEDFFPLGSRAVVGFIVVVSAGPLLGALVRYRRLPYPLEAALVIASVAAGMAIGYVSVTWVENYHDMLMGRHCCKSMSPPLPWATENISRILGRLMGDLPGWVGLFLVSGGLELPSYLSERRRLAESDRRRTLSALRRDKADADLRLTVLQAQIEPHFLFNTLASVRSLVRSEPERAELTIDAFSDYLRLTLPKMRRDLGVDSATLGEQVDICAGYLELMKIRMRERLSYAIDVAPDLRALAFPPLLLISLVENAVKHGLEPKSGAGSIVIRAHATGPGDPALEVAVEDDGVGLREGPGAGVGLANVRAQLHHRFGNRALLEIVNRAGGGVQARIVVPREAA
jgi:hypothetical protein